MRWRTDGIYEKLFLAVPKSSVKIQIQLRLESTHHLLKQWWLYPCTWRIFFVIVVHNSSGPNMASAHPGEPVLFINNVLSAFFHLLLELFTLHYLAPTHTKKSRHFNHRALPLLLFLIFFSCLSNLKSSHLLNSPSACSVLQKIRYFFLNLTQFSILLQSLFIPPPDYRLPYFH